MGGGVRGGIPSLTWRVSILKTLTILGAPPKGGRQAQVWGSLSVQMKQPDSSIPWTLNKLVGPQKWAEQVTHPCCPSRKSRHLGLQCPCNLPFGFQKTV